MRKSKANFLKAGFLKVGFLKASFLRVTAQSLILFISFSNATAQIGGPKDIKKAQAPKSASQTFEKGGVKVDFSIKSSPDADGRRSRPCRRSKCCRFVSSNR